MVPPQPNALRPVTRGSCVARGRSLNHLQPRTHYAGSVTTPTEAHPGIPGVAITGTIAAGKTSVAEAVSAILHERGMRHALLDIDWLGQLYPPRDAADPFSLTLAFRNLELIVPNFIDEGADYFVMALTLTSQEEMAALRKAIPQVHIKVCLLTASHSARDDRISSRDTGSLRDDFLRRTDALADQIKALQLHDFKLQNEGRPIDAVAAELLDSLRWLRH